MLHNLSDNDLKELYTFAKNDPRGYDITRLGYSSKFAYHIVRLICECEQIMTTGDLDLMRDKEMLKDIRRGEWTMSDIENFFEMKNQQLEKIYHSACPIPYEPDHEAIKKLLVETLEAHYGDLSKVVQSQKTDSDKILDEIRRLL